MYSCIDIAPCIEQEPIPQEVNIVNESGYHNNNGKESLKSIENIETNSQILSSPVATAELTIPTEETDNKLFKDTDGMFDKLSDLASSKASEQNDNSFVPFTNEDVSTFFIWFLAVSHDLAKNIMARSFCFFVLLYVEYSIKYFLLLL